MRKTPKYQSLFPIVLILLGAIMSSTKAVIIKLAYQHEVDTLSMLTLRMIFALPFFVGLAVYAEYKNRQSDRPTVVSNRDLLSLALLGNLGFFMASYLDFWGLKYIPAAMERLILFTYPSIVLLINVLIFKEKINRIQFGALALTYLGIAIAFIEGISLAGHPDFIFGSLLVFFCAVAYAVYMVGSGKLLPRLGTLRFSSYAMIFACLTIIAQHGFVHQWQLFDYPVEVYQLTFLMAIVATVLPMLMVSEGVRLIGASNASIIGSIGPISTIVLAYIFLGETLGLWQWLGTFIVIAGVLLISLQKSRNKKI